MSALLIEAAVKISLLVTAAALANLWLSRRSSAAARHLVWTLAIVSLLLLPILSLALPRWEVAVPLAVVNGSNAAPTAATAGQAAAAHAADGADVALAGRARVDAPATAKASEIARDASGAARSPWATVSWTAVLLALYAVGVLLLGLRLAAQRWTVRQLARRATAVSDPEWTALWNDCVRRINIQRPVRLLRSLDRTMPMAFGTRRPAVLIPSVADTWSEDRRRAVLLHELAHVARHDCFTQLLATVACAVYWAHPGVWWIARRLRVERELACDDRVLAAGAHAPDYAEHLLELAYALGGYRAPALTVSMARSPHVEGRLRAILDGARRRAAPARGGRLAGIAVMAALVCPLAAAQAIGVPADVIDDSSSSPIASASSARGGEVTSSPEVQSAAAANAGPQTGLPGTWDIRPTETAGTVHLQMRDSARSSHGTTIAIAQLEGFSPAWLTGAGGPVTFTIRRDAGVFAFEGLFRSGIGAGTYTFTASPTFAAEMAKRGFDRPTIADQYQLAGSDIGFAFLDELTAQRYARPTLALLVRGAQHGVSLSFLREMGQLGYHVGTVETLVTLRDHGVSPKYIQELRALGLPNLTADDLVRARDHGVSSEYVRELQALGYRLPLEELVKARDHGVSSEYVRDVQALGHRLTLAELINARDHGVSVEYIRGLAGLGYDHLPIDTLIRLRDHGVSTDYAKAMNERRSARLAVDDLINLRDRGVKPDMIK